MTRNRHTRTTLGATAALVLALAACTDGSEPPSGTGATSGSTSGSGSGSGSTQPQEGSVRSLAASVLQVAQSEPVATVQGTVKDGTESSPATAEVIQLTADANSSTLLFRITTPEKFSPDTAFFEADKNGNSIDGVTLTVGEKKYYPGIYRYSAAELAQNCTCTELIRSLGPEGVWLSASFEALPADTSQAKLTIPGFPATDVKVTTK